MKRQWPICCAAVGALVYLEWLAKMWLLSALLCAPCEATNVALTSLSFPLSATPRISRAGIHYGDCTGISFAVVLDPEPCGWERAVSERTLASR